MEYAKALTEVDEILDHLSEENYKKIPEDIISIIKQYKDRNYQWKYDETKKLKDQDVKRDTIAFLSYINMEYLVNEGQRDFLKRLHQINEEKQNKKEKNIEEFQGIKSNTLKEIEKKDIEETEKIRDLVVVKESIFRKIFNKIKNLFMKKEKTITKQQIEQKKEERKKDIVIPKANSKFYESLKN